MCTPLIPPPQIWHTFSGFCIECCAKVKVLGRSFCSPPILSFQLPTAMPEHFWEAFLMNDLRFFSTKTFNKRYLGYQSNWGGGMFIKGQAFHGELNHLHWGETTKSITNNQTEADGSNSQLNGHWHIKRPKIVIQKQSGNTNYQLGSNQSQASDLEYMLYNSKEVVVGMYRVTFLHCWAILPALTDIRV